MRLTLLFIAEDGSVYRLRHDVSSPKVRAGIFSMIVLEAVCKKWFLKPTAGYTILAREAWRLGQLVALQHPSETGAFPLCSFLVKNSSFPLLVRHSPRT